MTTAELIELLREARESVEAHEKALLYDDPKVAALIDLATRIDAALAERQDSATDVVEWHDIAGQGIQIAKVGDLTLRLVFHSYPPAWRWSVSHDRQDYGECFTEDEAKIAAIAAARGMR